eukprot:1518815-Prymnesium_polylepis.1
MDRPPTSTPGRRGHAKEESNPLLPTAQHTAVLARPAIRHGRCRVHPPCSRHVLPLATKDTAAMAHATARCPNNINAAAQNLPWRRHISRALPRRSQDDPIASLRRNGMANCSTSSRTEAAGWFVRAADRWWPT